MVIQQIKKNNILYRLTSSGSRYHINTYLPNGKHYSFSFKNLSTAQEKYSSLVGKKHQKQPNQLKLF
ncbi:MAG: hypothetical protein WAR79_11835 [Melioribacteraceae bacterium]